MHPRRRRGATELELLCGRYFGECSSRSELAILSGSSEPIWQPALFSTAPKPDDEVASNTWRVARVALRLARAARLEPGRTVGTRISVVFLLSGVAIASPATSVAGCSTASATI
jgi:hypothetical protein